MKSSTISFFGKNYKLDEIRLIRNANDPTGKATVVISVKSEENDDIKSNINHCMTSLPPSNHAANENFNKTLT